MGGRQFFGKPLNTKGKDSSFAFFSPHLRLSRRDGASVVTLVRFVFKKVFYQDFDGPPDDHGFLKVENESANLR